MGKHYRPLRRLGERRATTPVEWLPVGRQIGLLVNAWSARSDLAVYCGEAAANKEAVAAFYHDSAEIEVNVVKAFGSEIPTPELEKLTSRKVQFQYPHAIGVIFHEALHARHTNWDKERLLELDLSEGKAFMLLEEVRIETRGLVELPQNRLFLRESALAFALEDINEATLKDVSQVWQSGMLGVLAVGRFDSGILDLDDVVEIHEKLVENLGQDLFDKLRAIWVEFSGLKVSQIERGMELAREWVALLREADPEGEGGFGEEGEEGEAGEGAIPSELGDLVGKLAQEVSDDNSQSLADQEKIEDWNEEAKSRSEQSKNRNSRKVQAKQVFDKQNDAKGSGSSSSLKEQRLPTSQERVAAVAVAKLLEKAKYRERSIHEVRSTLPQGKLNFRAAVQNAALAARGSAERLPSWDRKVRKHTDDPTLRLAVMVDVSGSMGMAMEAMATTAWVMGEAGRRIQAKTAMVYYGSGVFPTLRVGQRLDEVRVFTAPDGTEEFDKAYQAIDGELGLTYGDGVRILVIVSDGQYRPDQAEAARRALDECKRNGVAVVWISPSGTYGDPAERLVEQAAWGTHLNGLEVSQIALEVGRAAARELGRVANAA